MRITNCQDLSFSGKLSRERIDRALEALGANVIRRLLCFALYLLGLNRQNIAKTLDMPAETVKSTIRTIINDGLSALQDRRRRQYQPLATICHQLPPIAVRQQEQFIIIDLGAPDRQLKIDKQDTLQSKIVLLTMLNSGLLTSKQVAEAIGLTRPRTMTLARQLMQKGALSLVDQRKGQKQDYRVSPQIKAELIQQFAVDAITGGATSGLSISDQLKERCQITISPRTVRHHLDKLGLSKIKRSLPELVTAVKKTSKAGASE
ncbi:hypothetical protein [Desulfosarcina ovata]|nr:hypothetical protein [Desulfosarcina ovata]